MTIDSISFAPPDDNDFQILMLRASRGQVPVYGVVIETEKVSIKRAYDSHHPENFGGGADIVRAMFKQWQEGNSPQPWLYVKDGEYIVSDDYYWIALIEQGRPGSFAAQVLGEPLPDGLVQKVGPLPAEKVQSMLGQVQVIKE